MYFVVVKMVKHNWTKQHKSARDWFFLSLKGKAWTGSGAHQSPEFDTQHPKQKQEKKAKLCKFTLKSGYSLISNLSF